MARLAAVLSPDDVPAHRELIDAGRRWVLWKLATPPGRTAPTKVPFTSGGRMASTTAPKSWAPYEAVKARFDSQPGAYNGLGFVFAKSGDPNLPGIVGIDLDKCRDPESGALAEWAVEVLDRFRSYAEVTPSKTGIHILCKGRLSKKGGRKGQVECYAAERFFTVTGEMLDRYPDELVEAQEALDWLWAEHLNRGEGNGHDSAPVDLSGHVEAAEFPSAKHKALLENDPVYARTWQRNRKDLADQSLSSYDMALAVRTAMVKWTEGEIVALIKAFRQTQGETEKANRTDYLLLTVRRAIAWVAEGNRDTGKKPLPIATGSTPRAEADTNGCDRVERIDPETGEVLGPEPVEAKTATEGSQAGAEPEPSEQVWWEDYLHRTKTGLPLAIQINVELMLRSAPEFAGTLRFNVSADAIECRGLPWDKGTRIWRRWDDYDDIRANSAAQKAAIRASPKICGDAARAVARERDVDPVRDYLRGLRWDGTHRLGGWLMTYLGAEPDSENQRRYFELVGRLWMISGAARALQPGCQADHALVLEGRQGLRKTSAIRALSPDPSWYAEGISSLDTKDSKSDLRGKWIIELAELAETKTATVARVKRFLTCASDLYRPFYGGHARDYPRRCIFAGSVNEKTYLQDTTGNRRFWPVPCGAIDIDSLSRDREQLWAEAVAAYDAGEVWYLDADDEKLAEAEQAARQEVDVWHDTIAPWLLHRVARGHVGRAYPIRIAQLLEDCLKLHPTLQEKKHSDRVADVLKILGWSRRVARPKGGGDPFRHWVPKDWEEPAE